MNEVLKQLTEEEERLDEIILKTEKSLEGAPDFTLLNMRTREEYYLEHFGMMDDPYYSEGVVKKIESYEKNGIFPGDKLLMTFETSKSPVNMKLFEQMIKRFLM